MAGNDTFDGVHRPATNWVRVHLSPNHLFSAFHHASMSRQLEQEGDVRDRATTERHRASVVGAVLAATAFLEASINELFYAAGDTNVAHPSLDETTRKSFDALWSVDGFRRSARVLEKFEVALQLAGSVPLAKGSKPYQDARLLVDLRNALVHYVPSTFVIEAGASQDESLDEFGKKFRGKFEENPWRAKYLVISSGSEPNPAEAEYPFFPERCLGSGCAIWASQSALEFADEFFQRLGIQWYYHHSTKDLPSL